MSKIGRNKNAKYICSKSWDEIKQNESILNYNQFTGSDYVLNYLLRNKEYIIIKFSELVAYTSYNAILELTKCTVKEGLIHL